MDGFELEIHYWGKPIGTVKISKPHSGVTKVIIHAYPDHMEIIECGKGSPPYATHFLGTRPEPLLYDEEEDEGMATHEQSDLLEERPLGPGKQAATEWAKDCCGGEPIAPKCERCGCSNSHVMGLYTCVQHTKRKSEPEDDVKDCCVGSANMKDKTHCSTCGCWVSGLARNTCPRHDEREEDCCDGYPTLGTMCPTCRCSDYGFSGFWTCPRHQGFDDNHK